jgi:VWFA-related protein
MESNLVLVPVVVRDAVGNYVHGLTEADFKIADRGKEQKITHFEEEYATATRPAGADTSHGTAAMPSGSALPGRFLTFFFDDLNTPASEWLQLRDAADHEIAARLQPRDRVAIFTTTQMLMDFTADTRRIHEALQKLRRTSAESDAGTSCPDFSEYQAQQLVEEHNLQSAAWVEATAEASLCKPTEFPVLGSKEAVESTIRILAERVLSQARAHAHGSLDGFERALQYTSKMPGARVVILATPGFLTGDMQPELDRIIDAALRSQVVIDGLDPKGVAVSTRLFDASRHAEVSGAARIALLAVEADGETALSDVLVQFTRGTGGEFYHSNNDLRVGFRLTEEHGRYILAFTPADLRQDGKFHPLQISLASPHPGFRLNARQGYFAPKAASKGGLTSTALSSAEEQKKPASIIEAQESEQIREAIYAQDESRQLAVDWSARAGSAEGENRDIQLFSHLDLNGLEFHRSDGHNVNRITFVVAVFDHQNKLVTVEQRHATVSVPDERLAGLAKRGVDIDLTVQLKPGIYRFRTIVTDSEEHRLAAASRSISVP